MGAGPLKDVLRLIVLMVLSTGAGQLAHALDQRGASLPADTARAVLVPEETWIAAIREEGARHGLEALSRRIFRTTSGYYYVPDDEDRAAILKLRQDPRLRTALAAACRQQAAGLLWTALGRRPTIAEQAIGDLLGPGNAARLIRTAEGSPSRPAAEELAETAHAQPHIFYDGDRPRTAAEVYLIVAQIAPRRLSAKTRIMPGPDGDWQIHVEGEQIARPPARPDIAWTARVTR